MKYLELKRHLDKPDAVYSCELSRRGPDFVLLRYISDRTERIGSVEIGVGAITYALYRHGQGFVTWRISGKDGHLLGHLFHICKDLKVGDDQVEYLDLMLDLWFTPDGEQVVLDREDLEAFVEKGLVSPRDLEWIGQQERTLTLGYEGVKRELDELLQGS